MNWVQSLFTDLSSPAHTIFIFAIVIAVGFKLGKIKIGSVALGSTCVLFAGILIGHIYRQTGLDQGGYVCPADTLNFIQDFGLILFVYYIC